MGEGAEVEEGGHCDLIEREGKEGGFESHSRRKKKKKNRQRRDRLIQETIGRDDCLSENVCCRPLLVSDISICAGYFQFDLTFNSLTSSVMSPLGVFEAYSNFNCR